MTTATVPPPLSPAQVPPSPANGQGEEMLVADARAGLRPSQFVEQKLATLLRACPLLVSQLQTARYIRR